MTVEEVAPPPRLVTAPTREVIGPVTDDVQLSDALHLVEAEPGPLAVDTERASGYRYSQRAYLIQLARATGPIVLIDPIAFTSLDVLTTSFADEQWVLHAASQDLPCLRGVGVEPRRLFDTEVAGRLLGLERVSLNTMLELFLGVSLEKGHSAADWSTRPLPADWLTYAALDVDLLVDLAAAVSAELDRAGKASWAAQEFAATLAAEPPPPRIDPWRRTSGIHALRSRRQLAVVRALWESRDEMAMARDIAPGRLLPDAAIIAAARSDPADADGLAKLPVFRGPRQRMHARRWFAAIDAARALAETGLPTTVGRLDGMPATNRWRERDPIAADRLSTVRAAITTVAQDNEVQAQNLLPADIVRRLCWQPPVPADTDHVAAALTDLGARPWQVELCAKPVSAAILAAVAQAATPSRAPDAEPSDRLEP